MSERVGNLVTMTGYLGNPNPGNPTIEHVIAQILADLGDGMAESHVSRACKAIRRVGASTGQDED
jgi:hypothetical protein